MDMAKVRFLELLISRKRNFPLAVVSTVIITINGLRTVIRTQAMTASTWWPSVDEHLGTWKSHSKMFPRFHGPLYGICLPLSNFL